MNERDKTAYKEFEAIIKDIEDGQTMNRETPEYIKKELWEWIKKEINDEKDRKIKEIIKFEEEISLDGKHEDAWKLFYAFIGRLKSKLTKNNV